LNSLSSPNKSHYHLHASNEPPDFASAPLLSSTSVASSSPRMPLILNSRRNFSPLASFLYLLADTTINGFKTLRTSVEIEADICPASLTSAIRAFSLSSTDTSATTMMTSSLGKVFEMTRVFKADPFALADAITTKRIPAMLLNKHSPKGAGHRALLLVTAVDSTSTGRKGVELANSLGQAVSLVFGTTTSSSSIFMDILSGTMLASGGSSSFTVRAISVSTSSLQTGKETTLLADLLLPNSQRTTTRAPTLTYINQPSDAPSAATITGAAGVALKTAADCSRFCGLVKKRIEGSLAGKSNISSSDDPADLVLVIAELETGASFSIAFQLCRSNDKDKGHGVIPSQNSALCSSLIQRDAIVSLIVV